MQRRVIVDPVDDSAAAPTAHIRRKENAPLPDVKVVKTPNTVPATVMTDPPGKPESMALRIYP